MTTEELVKTTFMLPMRLDRSLNEIVFKAKQKRGGRKVSKTALMVRYIDEGIARDTKR